MNRILSQLGLITLGIVLGYAGIVSAASLPLEGWAFSIMPTGTSENNQNYNPSRPDRNVGQGGGWISMSNETGGGSIDYGVTVDDTTGNFSGEAWNTYLGYVNFSNARIANPTCLRDGTGTSAVLGTITFLSASQPQAGGWDGIVDMAGNWTSPVMVDCSTGTLSGYGWGDYVVGWVDFKWVKITKSDVCTNSNALNFGEPLPCQFEPEEGDVYCITPENDIIYFNPDDYPPGEGPEECEIDDGNPPSLCTDPALCPIGPGPIYKEN